MRWDRWTLMQPQKKTARPASTSVSGDTVGDTVSDTPRDTASDTAHDTTRVAATAGGETPVRVGVISDTHGYLDPTIDALFAGVTHIVHAGDFVDPASLAHLAAIAPVTAVCGNVDPVDHGGGLPREAYGRLPGITFIVGHKRRRLLKRLSAGKLKAPGKAGKPNLVIFGHEHAPFAAWVDGVLWLNPGTAASPYEEDDDPTVALVEVGGGGLSVTFVPLARRPLADA